MDPSFKFSARFLRKVTATSDLEKTMRRATSTLAGEGVPSLVLGGYAVQEHGYPYTTMDVDIVVPDVARASEILSISGFKLAPGTGTILYDRTTKVEINLLPGGGRVGPGPLPLPVPTEVVKDPIIDLQRLIETKLSSYIGNPVTRAKDFSAVVELTKANKLPRDYSLDPQVKPTFQKMWDDLEAEKHNS